MSAKPYDPAARRDLYQRQRETRQEISESITARLREERLGAELSDMMLRGSEAQ